MGVVLERTWFVAKYLVFVAVGVASIVSSFDVYFIGLYSPADPVIRTIKSFDNVETTISNRVVLEITLTILIYTLTTSLTTSRNHSSYFRGFVLGLFFYVIILVAVGIGAGVIALAMLLYSLLVGLFLGVLWVLGVIGDFILALVIFLLSPILSLLSALWHIVLAMLAELGRLLLVVFDVIAAVLLFLAYPFTVVFTWIGSVVLAIANFIYVHIWPVLLSYLLSPFFWYVIFPAVCLAAAVLALFVLSPVSAAGKSFFDSARAVITLNTTRMAMFAQGVTVGFATFFVVLALLVDASTFDENGGIFDKVAVGLCIAHLMISIFTAGRKHDSVPVRTDFDSYIQHNKQGIVAALVVAPLVVLKAVPEILSFLVPSDDAS